MKVRARQDNSESSCTLRAWLNGDFYNSAFSDEERARIVQVTNATANAPDTQDCVFLLSLDELNAYFPDEASRIADATEYAVAQGGRVSRETGKTYWWLRTKATPEDAALMVRYDGAVNEFGDSMTYTLSVREVALSAGQAPGVTWKVVNRTDGTVHVSGLLDFTYGKQSVTFSLPETEGNWALFLYAGMSGATTGVTVVFRKVKLESQPGGDL